MQEGWSGFSITIVGAEVPEKIQTDLIKRAFKRRPNQQCRLKNKINIGGVCFGKENIEKILWKKS